MRVIQLTTSTRRIATVFNIVFRTIYIFTNMTATNRFVVGQLKDKAKNCKSELYFCMCITSASNMQNIRGTKLNTSTQFRINSLNHTAQKLISEILSTKKTFTMYVIENKEQFITHQPLTLFFTNPVVQFTLVKTLPK